MKPEALRISINKTELDVRLIHRFLSESSYWAKGISLPLLQKAIDNSLCFGGFVGTRHVAFARVISDFSTFANLVDVFVVPESRGQGYGKALIQAVVEHPQLQGLRRFTLATSDAHGLYARFGFKALSRPEIFMEIHIPDLYTAGS